MNKVLILFSLFLAIACNNRKDFVYEVKEKANVGPTVELKLNGSSDPFSHQITDTILLKDIAIIDFKISDDEPSSVSIKITDPLIINNQEIVYSVNTATITPQTVGLHTYSFKVTDKYGKTDEALFKLYVYKTTPILQVRKAGTTDQYVTSISDSVKIGKSYSTEYSITDAFPNVVTYKIDETQGTGNNTVDPSNKKFDFTGTSLGIHKYLITATNTYSLTATCNIQLTFFSNISPVADFLITNTKTNDPLEINIDAAKAFDPDQKYGGGISMYEYTIGTYTVTIPTNYLNYILPAPGTYTIKLRVKDNEGAWSAYKTQSITL